MRVVGRFFFAYAKCVAVVVAVAVEVAVHWHVLQCIVVSCRVLQCDYILRCSFNFLDVPFKGGAV